VKLAGMMLSFADNWRSVQSCC